MGGRLRQSQQRSHLDQIASDVTTGNVQAACQVRQRKAVVDGANVSDTITGVYHHTGQQTCTKMVGKQDLSNPVS